MPAEFQKAINLTLINCKNIYAYLKDILIVTKGSLKLHKAKLETILQKLDKKNFAISFDKNRFAYKRLNG